MYRIAAQLREEGECQDGQQPEHDDRRDDRDDPPPVFAVHNLVLALFIRLVVAARS